MLLVCAVSTLGYCGFVLLDTWSFQNREDRQLEQLLPRGPAEKHNVATPAALLASTKASSLLATDGLIGRISVPRLGMSAIVIEGTSARVLRRAVGHIAGTALPGEPGSVGIAGHRDTLFRPLRNIRENDAIRFTTPAGDYEYRVTSATIVSPTDVAVLEPGTSESLVLVTCYPFSFVGSAPARFIVRAERVP
jgi:sortase A